MVRCASYLPISPAAAQRRPGRDSTSCCAATPTAASYFPGIVSSPCSSHMSPVCIGFSSCGCTCRGGLGTGDLPYGLGHPRRSLTSLLRKRDPANGIYERPTSSDGVTEAGEDGRRSVSFLESLPGRAGKLPSGPIRNRAMRARCACATTRGRPAIPAGVGGKCRRAPPTPPRFDAIPPVWRTAS